MALERLRTCTHVGRLCKELGIQPETLRRWRMQAAGYEPWHAVAQRPVESLQQENERLKRALAEKTLEVDFLQGALQQIEARRQQNTASGASASTPKSGDDADARQLECGTDVSGGGGEPGQFLSLAGAHAASGRRGGSARGDPGDCAGASASLWLSAGDEGIAPPRLSGQSQACGAVDE